MSDQPKSKPLVYCGIDYSYTSPAICVWDSSKPFEFKNLSFYNYYTVKKYEGTHGKDKNISILMQDKFDNNEERFRRINQWAKAILMMHGVTDAMLEGYAMGSTSGLVFQIAENTSLLKQTMNELGINFDTPAPTAVKKAYTGAGNAKKEKMIDTFNKEHGVKIGLIIGADPEKPYMKPGDDLVDSYAILKMHPDIQEMLNE